MSHFSQGSVLIEKITAYLHMYIRFLIYRKKRQAEKFKKSSAWEKYFKKIVENALKMKGNRRK